MLVYADSQVGQCYLLKLVKAKPWEIVTGEKCPKREIPGGISQGGV